MKVVDLSQFYGSRVSAHQEAFYAFCEQACAARELLHSKSYLLDNYLNQLISMLIPTDMEQVAAYGSYAISSLRGVCFGIVRGRGKETGHPFRKQAAAYIEAHPLPYHEEDTRVEFYISALLPAFLDSALVWDGFLRKMRTDSAENNGTDEALIVDMFNRMRDMVGDEPLFELNRLFLRCFIPITSFDVFTASARCDWIYSLVVRDKETGLSTLQLLLDHFRRSAAV